MIITLGVVIVLAAIPVALISIKAYSNPVSTDGNGPTVQILSLAIPIADSEPISPSLYLGVPHTGPSFDTSEFGPDLSFQQNADGVSLPDSGDVLTAIYLGDDIDGHPFHIWLVGSRNLFEMLSQVVADFGSWGRLASSYGSLTTGSRIFDEAPDLSGQGLPTGSVRSGSDIPSTLNAEWHGLPASVAAVVFYSGEEAIGWQTPVSGTVAISKDYALGENPMTEDITLVALTTDGQEWNRIALFSANPNPFDHPEP